MSMNAHFAVEAEPVPTPPKVTKKLNMSPLRWAVILGLLIFLIAPIIPLVIWSFAFRWNYPDLLPSEYSMRAWEAMASPTNGVLVATWNSSVIAVVVTVLSILIGVPAGRALGLHKFRGKRLVELLIVAPIIVPTLAVALGMHTLFIRYGLSNSLVGVSIVHLIPALPYMTLVMAGVFANYDASFESQARSLGASPLKTQWYVTFPAIRPGLIVGALFTFLISWSEYVLTLLIGGGQVITLPLLLFNFARSGDNAIAGALAVVFIVPGILILLLTSKHLTSGHAAIGGTGT